MNEHEREEMDFGRNSEMWDADPDVCCAYYQLGACKHTEAVNMEDEDSVLSDWLNEILYPTIVASQENEPF